MLKTLGENLSLLAVLVVLVGISSTESYYGYFGLSYQLLNVPSDHLVYRGLTAVFAVPSVILLYLIAVAAIAAQSVLGRILGRPRRVQWLNYALVVMFAFAAWWAGRATGESAARRDATVGSTLPLVTRLQTKAGGAASMSAVDGMRLLLHSGDGLYMFHPVASDKNDTPLIKFLATQKIESFDSCAHC